MLLLLGYAAQINATIVRQDMPYKGNLYMTIFYDDEVHSALDFCTRQPFREVVMMMHGGYFLFGSRGDMDNTCIEFAKKGYTAITIDYRKGGYSSDQCSPSNGYNIIKAAYRAAQDAISALGFIKNNIAQFVPNTRAYNIAVGGFSAGAFTALNIGFVQQDEINADYPFLEEELGPLGNEYRVYPAIVLNNAGAVINTNYINAVTSTGASVPMPFVINMAALNDDVVPYEQGNYLNCASHPLLFGTKVITRRLNGINRCYLTVTADIGGHGAFSDAYVASIADDFINSLYNAFWSVGDCPPTPNQETERRKILNNLSNQVITLDRSTVCDNIPLAARPSSLNKKGVDPFAIGTLRTIGNDLQVNIQSNTNDLYKTEVYNLNGQLVGVNDWSAAFGNTQVEITLPKLNHGMYLVKVTSKQTNTAKTKKLFLGN